MLTREEIIENYARTHKKREDENKDKSVVEDNINTIKDNVFEKWKDAEREKGMKNGEKNNID